MCFMPRPEKIITYLKDLSNRPDPIRKFCMVMDQTFMDNLPLSKPRTFFHLKESIMIFIHIHYISFYLLV